MIRFMNDERGQMAVELAALIPVILVIAAVSFNALIYMGECARFDRVAAEAVRVYGASPGYGQYSASACNANIKAFIEDSFGDREGLDFSVISVDIGAISGHELRSSTGLVFSIIPSNRKYSCTMSYTPIMFRSGVFGASFGQVEHVCEFVVDPYKPQGFL